ncbi:MAG: oligosaccharide flippase family protein [Candidatus Peribacteraceae bacterium]
MHSRAITVSTLWQIGSQAVMAVLSAVTVKFVAIGLSQELAGVYNSAYGFLQLFAILADFGLYAVSINELSKSDKKEDVLGALLTIRVALTACSLGAAILIAWVIPIWHGTALPLSISIAALVPVLTLLAGVLRTVFQIAYRMHIVFIAEVLQRLVTAILMSLVIYSGVRSSNDSDTLHLFLWLGVLGSLTLFLISFVFALRSIRIRFVFRWSALQPLLLRALPYGAAFLCIALYRQFDLTMIALLRDDFQLQNAKYGFALRVAEMTYLVPTFLLNSALPVLSANITEKRDTQRLLRSTLTALLLLGLFSSIFAALWARPLMHLFTDTVYLSSFQSPGADTALLLLAPSMFLNMIVLFSFYVLLSRHRWQPMMLPMLLAVVLSIAMNLFLIPRYGFSGAAVTLGVVHLLLAITLFPIARAALPFHFPLADLLRIACVGVGLILVAILLLPVLQSTIGTILGGTVALILSGCVLLLSGIHRSLVRHEAT